MSNFHLVIPDLFLPQQVAAEAGTGLALPALEKILARAKPAYLSAESLETWLCKTFGVVNQSIAPVTLRADGLEPGTYFWLRADPAHLRLHRDQLILQTAGALTVDEAANLSASLNAHFVTEGLRFFAPQPQRWYLQLDTAPGITTHPFMQVLGSDVQPHLPQGEDALHWHGVFNEIQMLLFEHPVNQARESRGELPVNSVWFWGGGHALGNLAHPYDKAYGDNDLTETFARATGIPYISLPGEAIQCVAGDVGEELVVWEGLRRALKHGDIHAWREELQQVERDCAKPLLDALREGHIDELTLVVPHDEKPRSFVLTRGAIWKLWQRPKALARYAV